MDWCVSESSPVTPSSPGSFGYGCSPVVRSDSMAGSGAFTDVWRDFDRQRGQCFLA
jgi:hypothetical protein